MISAPSEMRCRSMPMTAHDHEHRGQHQRDRERHDGARAHAEAEQADAEHDGDGLPQGLHELVDRVLDGHGLVGDQRRLDPDRQVLRDLAPSLRATLCPSARTSPPVRMAMAMPMPCWPLTRNIGCAGSAGPRVTWAMSPRRIMPAAGDEVDGRECPARTGTRPRHGRGSSRPRSAPRPPA